MRTALGVMLLAMAVGAPAWADVTEPTEQVDPPKEMVVEPAATPAPAPASTAAPAPAAAAAQDDGPETLFGGRQVDHGGYGGPEIKFGRVAGRDAVFFGGKGGWIIDHLVVLGGGGFGLTNNPSVPDRLQTVTGIDRRITMGYGGGMIEYFVMPDKLVHGTLGVLVGGGAVNITERSATCRHDDTRMDCQGDEVANDSFFIMEPEAGLEVNVVRFLRLNAGVSYRYVTGVGGIGFENDDLRGFNGTFTVKFGAF